MQPFLFDMITKVVIVYCVAINVIAYLIMWYDKQQAIKKQQRISEKKLFFVAFIFGALGIYLGMKAPLYHKAAKWQFKIGIPILIILNIFLIYFMESKIFSI